MAFQQRQSRGRMSETSGRVAEDLAIRHYLSNGARLLEKRWRSSEGEIDLIFRFDNTILFVEVKSSQSQERALQMLGRRQLVRIFNSAAIFLGTLPDGLNPPSRIDLATVAGGKVATIEGLMLD